MLSPTPPLLDLLPVFNAQPGATLLLSPEWVIVGASDDYLAATLTERATLVGKHIFEAFPDNPETPEANAVANVRASIAQVLATKAPHEMAPQHYDVPDPAQPGRFVERYWQPRHTPVLDAQGQVLFIIQSVQDITARRLAEQQLRDSQERERAAHAEAEVQRGELQRLFEQAPVAMALFQGPDYRIELANEPMATIWGRPLAQTLGQPVFTALPYVQNQGFEALFADVLAQGTAYHLPEVPVTLDWTPADQPAHRYFNLTYRPQRDGHGQITGIFTIAQDVTEQVLARQHVEQLNQQLEARVQERTRQLEAAQAATERQRRQWHELFRQAPAGICIFDGPEWVYEFVNPGYQAMFPGRALLGKRLVDALPEVADQPLMAILHRVYDTGEPFEASEVLVPLARTAGGPVEDIYFDLTYQARRNEAGQIDGFITYATDVTEQVRARHEREALQAQQLAAAEQRSQEREELYQVFSQSSALILLLRGPEHRIEYVNAAYARLFPGRGLHGSPIAASLPEAEAQGFTALLDGVYRTGQPHAGLAVPLTFTPAGGGPPQTTYFNFTYQAYQEHGRTQGVSVFAYDATEQVRARQQVQDLNEELAAINEELTATNEELNESNTQLTRTNVDLDNFIYTASHDLKAPISNIEGLLLALEHELPEAARPGDVPLMLTLMQDAVDRFRRTITHLTDLSRLQKEHNPASEAVALAPVVEAVRLDLPPPTPGQLTVTIPEGLTVTFAEKNLRSVVYNLLSNAFKYRHPDRAPDVQLRSWAADDFTVLEVQDNGLGLDLAQGQEQLFAMFQRLHTHVEGTGVGLYMVKRILENAGGRIEVTSRLGQGSTFRVYFRR